MAEVVPKEVDREGVRLLVRRGAQLVDVLAREEYESVHLAGAVSIPMSMISRHTADRLQWDKPVIVYSKDCLCDLSARAAWRLSSMGFTQVYRYTNGKADWLANGLPAEGSAAQRPSAGDLADLDVPTCKRGERVSAVKEQVSREGTDTCVVVNDQFIALGLLRPNDLNGADPNWTAEEAMERDPQTYRLDAPIEGVAEFLKSNPTASVLVTTPDGKLFGLLKRGIVEQALREK